jgi:two-component system, sensor histidine kinase and response regulator
MDDKSPVGADPDQQPVRGGRNSQTLAYGIAGIATLLAAISWLYPSGVLAGILFLVVAASTFAMAIYLSREERAREAMVASHRQSSKDAARVQAFLRNVRDGVHILDTDGDLIDASDSFCRMLGYTREEMIGMHVLQWDAIRSPEEMRTFLDELFANPETVTFETRHRRKDGSLIDVEVYGCPVEINGQRVLFHSSRDISDRKLAEARYRDIYQDILSVKGGRKEA